MEKPIGAEELVYAKIVELVPQQKSISIKFKHLSGKLADHCYSFDKDKFSHCYRQLELGQHYIIATKHVGKKRWVWTKALLVSSKEQKQFRDIAGLCPSVEQMEQAMNWLRDYRNPPMPPSISELLEF